MQLSGMVHSGQDHTGLRLPVGAVVGHVALDVQPHRQVGGIAASGAERGAIRLDADADGVPGSDGRHPRPVRHLALALVVQACGQHCAVRPQTQDVPVKFPFALLYNSVPRFAFGGEGGTEILEALFVKGVLSAFRIEVLQAGRPSVEQTRSLDVDLDPLFDSPRVGVLTR